MQRVRSYILILAFYYTCPVRLLSQEIRFDHFDRSRGLSDNIINAVTGDEQGYLWLGSRNGLTRFDGKNFLSISLPQSALSEIHTLYAFHSSNIWIGFSDGKIARYNGTQLHMIPGLTDMHSPRFFGDRSGRLWIATDNHGAVLVKNPSEEDDTAINTEVYDYSRGLTTTVYQVYQLGNGRIFFVTMAGIKYLDEASGSFKNFLPVDFPIMEFTCMVQRGRELWFGAAEGLVKVTEADRSFHVEQMWQDNDYSNVTCAIIDRHQSVWFGTWEKGIIKIDDAGPRKITMENGLKGDKIRCLYTDNEGNVWIGIFENGLSGFKGEVFTSITSADGVPLKSVHSLYYNSSSSILFAGTDDGLLRIEKGGTGTLEINRVATTQGLRVFAIEPLEEPSLALGIFGKGLMMINIKNPSAVGSRYLFHDRDENLVTSLKAMSDTTLAVGYVSGALLFNYRTRRVRSLKNTTDPDVVSLARDAGGTLYMGTNRQGLWECRGDSCSETAEQLFRGKMISALAVTRDALLIGTGEGMLYEMNKKRNIKELPYSGHIKGGIGFIAATASATWFGTGSGICELDGDKIAIRYFDKNTGFEPVDLQPGAYAWAFDSLLAIGTTNGLLFLNRNGIAREVLPPKLTLHTVMTGDSIPMDPQSTLDYRNRQVIFNFSAVSLTYPYSLDVRYRLSGYSEEWVQANGAGEARFSRLPEGDYVFELSAMVAGVSNSKVRRSFAFSIAPPFWKTTWFIALAVALFLVITYMIYRAVLKQKLRKRTMEFERHLQMAELEMKSFRSQMNPHFIFNSLQSIQKFLLASNPAEANEYLLKFSRLMRLILENSLHDTIPLEEDMRALQLYMELESLRMPFPMEFKIEYDESVHPEGVEVPPLLLQPFVENAIWHGLHGKGAPGLIKITFSIRNKILYCAIKDNGIGRGASKEVSNILKKKSLGVKITRERLALLGERLGRAGSLSITDLFDPDGKPAGTLVEINMPIPYD